MMEFTVITTVTLLRYGKFVLTATVGGGTYVCASVNIVEEGLDVMLTD